MNIIRLLASHLSLIGFHPFALLWCMLFSAGVFAQGYNTDKILYGVAYYDSYMPESRIEEDIKLMKECGINTVRLAESTWSTWEPEDGVFDFSRLDKMLDAFYEADIGVIVGTPTYAVPQWLVRKHPEIMVTRFDGQAQYGSRQNMDITNPDYLRHSERIIRKIVERSANHPGVIGFQLDNETKSYHTASKFAKARFIQYLKEKFITPDSLNKAWNLYYWSQSIANWEELHITGSSVNQAFQLEWSRFQQQLATNFLLWQRKIVDEYRKPYHFVTQNFDYHWRDGSVGPQSEVDHFAAAQAVTIAGTDIYHTTQDELDGMMIAFGGDNTRGLKHDNYFVLETNGQSATWHSDKIYIPYDGQLRQAFYAHLASGANMVAYWPWHNIHNAGETYWKGILGHDLQPNRGFYEVKNISREVSKIQQKLVNLKKQNDAAILYSIDAFNALKIKQISSEIDYADIFMQVYRSFYKNNIETDIITPHNFDIEKYELVVIPPLLISDDALLTKIKDYVKNGGHVLMFYKSGYADENYTMRQDIMPGMLREVCGFYYQDYTNTKKTVPLKDNPFGVQSDKNTIERFIELLVSEKCNVLAYYDHKHWEKYAAITQNQFGKGTMTYVGTLVSDEILDKIVANVGEKAGLKTSAQKLVFPLIVKSGTNQDGNIIHYIFNFSDEPQVFNYPSRQGVNVITGESVKSNDKITLEAWGVIIVESN